ncbi:hypothetical protein E2I00_019856 [Balaenoptera physalus]|uniref:Helix-hairpin-helix DNA-binding motif class 1 domain-containing protein n=1 Tax=Balaenoptera physalus TaxID=9770 RepID=A0A643C4Q4_BALPH|nr:hypothetical protein E2I00_019856 [Balaenoptera physalus]
MGSTLGCHRSIPRDPSDLSHSRKFSAACNFSNILVNQERLNINTATEEELMTLPGVTRAVARSIVEYREYIGGFKKVEDLALVSGVGATKLEQVKFEICVSSKGSSAQHSPSSLRRDLLAEQQPHHLATSVPLTPRVNINTATPAQLMSVRGLTEKMAVSIVDYRREHGPFRSVEDLVRMGGVNAAFLDRIRHQVFAERSRPPSTHTNGGLTFTAKPHPSPTSLSLQSEDLDLPPGGPTQIISTRPSVEAFGGTRDGRPVLRLATWNLQGCSVEKANNPGVREVVCMTLLENRWVETSAQRKDWRTGPSQVVGEELVRRAGLGSERLGSCRSASRRSHCRRLVRRKSEAAPDTQGSSWPTARARLWNAQTGNVADSHTRCLTGEKSVEGNPSNALLGVHNLLASTLHVMLTFDLLPLPSSVDSHCHGNPKAPVGDEQRKVENHQQL